MLLLLYYILSMIFAFSLEAIIRHLLMKQPRVLLVEIYNVFLLKQLFQKIDSLSIVLFGIDRGFPVIFFPISMKRGTSLK